MAVVNTAAFGQAALMVQALVTTAKTNIGTSTNTNAVSFGTLPTGNSVGYIINGICAIPNNTVTAQWCAVYYSTDSGTTLRVFAVGTMTAYTAAATSAPTTLNFTHPNGVVISPSNPVFIPYSATTLLYAAMGVSITDGAVFTVNGAVL